MHQLCDGYNQPDIVFDEKGVCNHCHEYEEKENRLTSPWK